MHTSMHVSLLYMCIPRLTHDCLSVYVQIDIIAALLLKQLPQAFSRLYALSDIFNCILSPQPSVGCSTYVPMYVLLCVCVFVHTYTVACVHSKLTIIFKILSHIITATCVVPVDLIPCIHASIKHANSQHQSPNLHPHIKLNLT